MTGVNLLPPELIERRAAEKRVFFLLAVIIVYLVALIGVYVWMIGLERGQQALLAQYQQDNKKLEERIAEFQVFEQRKAEASRREKLIEKAMAGNLDWHKLLLKLSFIVPGEVSIENFSAEITGGLKISGQARDYISVARWIVRLEEMEELDQIWLGTVDMKGDSGLVTYNLTAQFKAAQAMAAAPVQ